LVSQVGVLAGGLVDAVDIGWLHEVLFGDRQADRPSVDLPGAGEHHLDARIVTTACLEDRQLAAAVDLEVGVWVLHAVDVADLAGEVEDDLLIAHQVIHRAGLTHIGDVDADAVFYAGDVEQVAAVFRDQ
jgi:hypothetical protein